MPLPAPPPSTHSVPVLSDKRQRHAYPGSASAVISPAGKLLLPNHLPGHPPAQTDNIRFHRHPEPTIPPDALLRQFPATRHWPKDNYLSTHADQLPTPAVFATKSMDKTKGYSAPQATSLPDRLPNVPSANKSRHPVILLSTFPTVSVPHESDKRSFRHAPNGESRYLHWPGYRSKVKSSRKQELRKALLPCKNHTRDNSSCTRSSP